MDMNGHSKVYSLTEREHEVLRCVAQGLSNAAIAGRLGISSYTVRNHLTHIFEKLDVHSRSHAVALVFSHRTLYPLSDRPSPVATSVADWAEAPVAIGA
jgi:DNA-binding CsgD family transcriptional regulator